MPAERIALHGNNKSAREIERAVGAGVGRIVLDSFQEIVRVAAVAERLGVRQRVQIRVTVGVEAHTHEFIATAHEDQKFGIALAGGQAAEAVRRALKLESLELVGIHSHIGSQIFDTSGFEVAAHRVVGLLRRGPRRARRGAARDRPRRRPRHRVHPGRRPARAAGDRDRADRDRHPGVRGGRARACRGCRWSPAGRSSARRRSRCTRSAPSSRCDGLRTYVSVDGGMSDNIRTALYDAEYSVALVSRSSEAAADAVAGGRQALRVAATSWCGTPSCRPTWRRATCSRCRPPARTAGRWRATTTTRCGRRWWRSATDGPG